MDEFQIGPARASADHAQIAESDGVLIVRFNRPDKLNAISPQMTETLWHATQMLSDRDDLRVMVLEAHGRYFTAGLDLNTDLDNMDGNEPVTSATRIAYRRNFRRHTELLDEFEAIEKPIILAAQGPCLGFGLEIATSCDARIAADTATFGLPETKLGIIPASGGTSRLTNLVGPGWAKWMAMFARTVDAATARTIGLAQLVLPLDGFHQQVMELAREFATLPVEAVGLAKLSIGVNVFADRRSSREIERLIASTLFYSDEFQERLAQFRDRSASRPPGRSEQPRD